MTLRPRTQYVTHFFRLRTYGPINVYFARATAELVCRDMVRSSSTTVHCAAQIVVWWWPDEAKQSLNAAVVPSIEKELSLVPPGEVSRQRAHSPYLPFSDPLSGPLRAGEAPCGY